MNNNKIRAPGQQSRVLILDREDGLSELLEQLTVIILYRVDGQRKREIWELKHLHRLRTGSQS